MHGSLPRRRVLLACSTLPDDCHRGLIRFATQHNWHLVTDMLFSGQFPRGWRGDGIIHLASLDREVEQQILECGAPTVAIGHTELACQIGVVAAEGTIGALAANHLLERSLRHYAFAPYVNSPGQEQLRQGFAARLLEYGFTCHALPAMHRRIGRYWHDNWEEYRARLSTALKALPKPVGIYAGNDCVASEILEACLAGGISVPDQVCILGHGNNPLVCERAVPALSSVAMNLEPLAFEACSLLHKAMEGEPVPPARIVAVEAQVVARLSTDSCAVEMPLVAASLAYISEHYGEFGLSVNEVASAMGVSRRHLERRMRKETGQSVNEQILKRRMQEASRLLRVHPKATVSSVAEWVGYQVPRNFFRNFRSFYGVSPDVHRRLGPETAASSEARVA